MPDGSQRHKPKFSRIGLGAFQAALYHPRRELPIHLPLGGTVSVRMLRSWVGQGFIRLDPETVDMFPQDQKYLVTASGANAYLSCVPAEVRKQHDLRQAATGLALDLVLYGLFASLSQDEQKAFALIEEMSREYGVSLDEVRASLVSLFDACGSANTHLGWSSWLWDDAEWAYFKGMAGKVSSGA